MVLFYTHNYTPRLQYILNFLSAELFDEPIYTTTDVNEFKNSALSKINYSNEAFSENEFFLKPVNLLFENDIRVQKIDCFEINFHKAFYQTQGDFPFDVLAASFYLLSRYEEYLPYEKDVYGRYAHTNSLAYKEGFLQLPLVNIWVEEFKKALIQKYPSLQFKVPQFKCVVTYDIDIAYSYLHKGWLKNIAGFVRSMIQNDWKSVQQRMRVLRRKEKDPFDCFEWLDALHLYCRLKPYYFFLVAKKQKGYDKNISTEVKAFRRLIEYYAATYKIGIHPSWQSGDDIKLLKEEKEWLEIVSEKSIIKSRQHYIRFVLPHTFQQLIEVGIEKDFSMGYGSINGFRASICSPFFWYNLQKEESTTLMLYPFCYMDANSFFEQNFSPQQAYTELMNYYTIIKKLNGTLITIWHNHMLGSDLKFKGWNEMFELFMKETVYWDAYCDEA